uniref:Odorant receptor n=1 Tax=Microplitis mediator TaxID=375433 RepID=A0A0H4KNW0_9HYME|nr:odorant receptor 16 [Microplitis mediator]
MKLPAHTKGYKVTPEGAVNFIRVTVYLTCISFPLTEKTKVRINYEIILWLSIFLSISLFAPLLASIIKYSDDTFIVMKSFILMSAISNYVIKVIIVRIYHKELQQLGSALDEFIKKANESEKVILQRYVDNTWKFHGFMTCSYYLTATAVLLGPLILPQKFPTDAVYPFPVDNQIISYIVYLHQCIVGYQCSAGMALDCQAALFLWYLSARFEILISEAKNVETFDELRNYIKKHQIILLYAKELIRPTRLIAFVTVVMTKIGMIFGGIVLISDEPVVIKIQFAILVISTTINIYVCAWAADNLITVSSTAMSNAIFEISWMHAPKLRNFLQTVIHRTQKPVVIKIPGLLETLSNEYYAQFLSAAFSCFAAARVVVSS